MKKRSIVDDSPTVEFKGDTVQKYHLIDIRGVESA